MNCRDWEEVLALYAGSDLPPGRALEAERHLAGCPGCQVFVSGLREGLVLLRSAHHEIPAPAHFAAVRARVLSAIERGRRPLWRRAWFYPLAAAALVLVLALAWRPARWQVPPPPRLAVLGPRLPVPPLPPPVPAARPQPSPRRPRPVSAPAEPVLMRVVTANPDVVIYWISERRGAY